MRYFEISTGLRGCYLPDQFYMVKCQTRRELKSTLESEAELSRQSGFVGASKKAVAAFAADIWRNRYTGLPTVLGYGSPGNAHSGIHVSESDMRQFRKWQKESAE